MRKVIKLEVAEADNRDVDEEIVRIYRPARRVIGITNEEMLKQPLITIKNPKNNRMVTVRTSVALDSQRDSTKIFMNWMIRAKLGIEIGDTIIVSKASNYESLKYKLSHLGDSFFFGIIFAMVIIGSDFFRYIATLLIADAPPTLITLLGDFVSLLIWLSVFLITRKIKT
ncbi:MAG: hypothetical protein ACTSSP_12920 [Candidatus Asgardarchaeia archaeon]